LCNPFLIGRFLLSENPTANKTIIITITQSKEASAALQSATREEGGGMTHEMPPAGTDSE
jgi:hypothetical protein